MSSREAGGLRRVESAGRCSGWGWLSEPAWVPAVRPDCGGDLRGNPGPPGERSPIDRRVNYFRELALITSARATGAPPRRLLSSAASMNAMISNVSSAGTGGVLVWKNVTISFSSAP